MAGKTQAGSGSRGVPKTLRNRIVGSGSIDVAEIRKNPSNWRKHPADQLRALEDVLDQVGWIQNVIVNRTTGNLVDGHARVEIAEKRKEKTLPAVFVEITPEEEDLVLASIDPISALAKVDDEKLAAILERIRPEGEGLRKMLDDLGSDLQEKTGTKEKPEVEFAEELLEEHNFVVLYFDNSVDWLNLQSILDLPTVQASHSKKGFEVRGTGRVVNGAEALEKFRKWGRDA